MKFDIYQPVTDKIIEAIEAGAGDFMKPWRRGGAGGIPVNALTDKEYQGINAEPCQDHAQYISGWLSVLKKDKKAIFTASAKAQEAVTILGDLHE